MKLIPSEESFNSLVRFITLSNNALFKYAQIDEDESIIWAKLLQCHFNYTLSLYNIDAYAITNSLFSKIEPNYELVTMRNKLTFLSYLYLFKDIEKAKSLLLQTEKRCVIKDFWNWLIFEDAPHEWRRRYDEMCNCKMVNIIQIKDASPYPVLIPFICHNTNHFVIEDYEYTLNGWEKTRAATLPAHKLEENTHIIETLLPITFSLNHPGIILFKPYFKDLVIIDNYLMLHAIPVQLGIFVLSFIRNIKEYKHQNLNKLNPYFQIYIENNATFKEFIDKIIAQNLIEDAFLNTLFPDVGGGINYTNLNQHNLPSLD